MKNNIQEIELYYERYMKEYEFFENYKKFGAGTLFGGDGGYCNSYEDLIEKLKDDLKRYIEFCEDEGEDIGIKNIDEIEFVKIGYLTTFIKGLFVTFN